MNAIIGLPSNSDIQNTTTAEMVSRNTKQQAMAQVSECETLTICVIAVDGWGKGSESRICLTQGYGSVLPFGC